MAPAQRTGRSRYRLALLILTSITLLSLDFRSFGPLDAAQSTVRDLLHPVTSVVGTALSPIGDAWNAAFRYGDLESENQELRRQIDEMSGLAIEVEADSAAFARLQKAVDIRFGEGIPTVAATVLRGEVGNFDTNVVTISKGSNSGIREGMAVVTGAGLVGRIDQVDRGESTVELISEPSLVVGVRVVSTDEVGLGHGVAGEPHSFVIDQGPGWPENGDPALLPRIGSAVVTATDSRYSAEIPVGTVVDVSTPDGLAMVITVELSNDVTDLGFVSVMLDEAPDEVPLLPVVPSTLVPIEIDPAQVESGASDGTAP